MRGRGIQHRHRTLEDVLRLPAGLADRDEPDTAYLGDASQHVAQHTALRVRRVVELVDREQLDDVDGREAAVRGRAEIVGGPVALRATARGVEKARRRVETTAGEEPDGEGVMGGAAHARVDSVAEQPEALPLRSDQELDGEPADQAPLPEHARNAQARLLDEGAPAIVRGERASLREEAERTAADLVVGGGQDDLSARIDPHLPARGVDFALDVLLHDCPQPADGFEVALRALRGLDGTEGPQGCPERAGAWRPWVGEDGGSLAPGTGLRPEEGAAKVRPAPPQLAEGLHDVALVPEILDSFRHRDAGLAKQAAGPGPGGEEVLAGIRGVERDPQQHREPPLERGRAQDGQVRAVEIGHGAPDALHEARALQDLLGERPRRVIVGGEQGETGRSVARGNPGEELQVVLEHRAGNRLGGHVDGTGARIAETDEEEEQRLLVEEGAGTAPQRLRGHGDRRADPRRVGLVVSGKAVRPQPGEAGLEAGERLDFLVGRETPGYGRPGRGRRHDQDVGRETHPRRKASDTASSFEWTSSFSRMLWTWLRAVATLMPSFCATSLFWRPAATHCRTSFSRGVRSGLDEAGPAVRPGAASSPSTRASCSLGVRT